MSREPSEWIKLIIGVGVTLLSSAVIGLVIFAFNTNAQNAVQEEQIKFLNEGQKSVVAALNKNTDAINSLKVLIEGLKK